MRVVVTGANGFIGRALCARLGTVGHDVIAVVRRRDDSLTSFGRLAVVPDYHAPNAWRETLSGNEVVIHLAARAHRADASDARTRNEFRRVNVDATRSLTTQAVAAGIQHIIYMSSIKACAECSLLDNDKLEIIDQHTAPRPTGPYGESKLAAERLLAEMCERSGISLTIFRPPLVYGPGVRGNLATLLNAILRGLPLPFGSIKNQRSLIHREHLIDAIMLAFTTKLTGTSLFTLSDCVLSTSELVRLMAAGLRRPAYLIPCPVSVLRMLGKLTRTNAVSRLTESLVVDSDAIRRELGWQPRVDLASAWAEIGEQYRRDHS